VRLVSGKLSNRQVGWLARAGVVAELSGYKHRHGAVIVQGGSVVSVGVNRVRNHPDNVCDPKREASVHAEVAAIRGARGACLRGATLYVARVRKGGEFGLSRPCVNCLEEIGRVGIRKVVYSVG
jgi:deoxycytidylate deaminase